MDGWMEWNWARFRGSKVTTQALATKHEQCCTQTIATVCIYRITNYLTIWLTTWSRVCIEKPIFPQLVKEFPTFYGRQRLIAAFTKAR
jgi:hypothetical protein